MSTTFPNTIQTIPNPTGTDLLENAVNTLDHDYQHDTANDTLAALQAKVGINSSAVSTSHDYKLSGVSTGDKAVSLTGAETMTNKVLTAPQINIGSDAAGDLYYRNGSGIFTRLAIGADGTILSVLSGLPLWIANPSAADASTTVKGVSEIATTAEITAGTATGSTGAALVIPASAVGPSGASKIVQYTAGGLYPAVDGSLITNLTFTTSRLLSQSSVPIVQNISDTAEHALFTFSVPANTLLTGNIIRLKMFGAVLNQSGTVTNTVRIKYGSTTIWSGVLTEVNESVSYNMSFETNIYATGSASSQTTKGTLYAIKNAAGSGTANAYSIVATANSSEVSSGALNLSVTTQLSSTSNAQQITISDYSIERIS